MIQKTEKKCFVITPIGNETDSIRRHIDGIIDAVILPVLGQKYKINVAHRMANPGSINRQILQEIYESDLVIANLTEKNPNVMYELAFRHSLGTPCIMIAERDTKLPFDINGERTISYINDSQGVIELKAKLKECEASIEFNSNKKVGPIYDALRETLTQEKILENIEVQNEGDIDAFQHIFSKLSEIDQKVGNLKNDLGSKPHIDYLKNYDNNHLQQSFWVDTKLKYELDGVYSNELVRQVIREMQRLILSKYGINAKEIFVAQQGDGIVILTSNYWPEGIESFIAEALNKLLSNYNIRLKSDSGLDK